jgi:hypothetical protein
MKVVDPLLHIGEEHPHQRSFLDHALFVADTGELLFLGGILDLDDGIEGHIACCRSTQGGFL